jgi:hypothetical protein
MTAKLTSDWWVCFCDQHGNVRHLTVREWLGANRLDLLQGTDITLPVALADSLDSSQEAGRIVKRQIAAAIAAQRSEAGDQKSEEIGNQQSEIVNEL